MANALPPCECVLERTRRLPDGRTAIIKLCPVHAAAPRMLRILAQILDDGAYDDEGDFYLVHRDGPTPEADYLDPEPIAEARELLVLLGQRRKGL